MNGPSGFDPILLSKYGHVDVFHLLIWRGGGEGAQTWPLLNGTVDAGRHVLSRTQVRASGGSCNRCKF